VAPELLGKYLVRRIGKKLIAAAITEVEAYDGWRDKASHAFRGKTNRNFSMFGESGRWYVYFIYGNYWMLNIVTGKRDYPSAVLIRGVVGASGPGRLTKFFKIGKRFNNLPANRKTGLLIESRPTSPRLRKGAVHSGPRIGVAYAGPYWSKKKWRFYIGS